MKPVSEGAISSFIEERFLSGRKVALDEDLLLTGQIDSLGIVALVAHLEELREAPIPAQDVTLENFKTVSAIAAYLNGV